MISITYHRFGDDLEVFSVTNEAGEVWSFEPEEDGLGWGAGLEHVWIGSPTSTYRIYHFPSRTMSGSFALPRRSDKFRMHRVSADGRRLYILDPVDDDQSTSLHVVDFATGAIVASYDGIPGFTSVLPIEWLDGRLLIWRLISPDTPGTSIATINPSNGTRRVERLSSGPAWDQVEASPDGKYLVRPDPRILATRSSDDTGLELFERTGHVGPGGERYYGVTWQVWQTDPLKFLRRIIVAWVRADELPDWFRFRKDRFASTIEPELLDYWDMMAAVMSETDPDPGLGTPARKSFPNLISESQRAWKATTDNLEFLHLRLIRLVEWEADGRAFWIVTKSSLSRVELSGRASPRLYLERLGFELDSNGSVAVYPGLVHATGHSRATVDFRYPSADGMRKGSAVLDGQPSDNVCRIIPSSDDHWEEEAASPEPVKDPRGNRIDIILDNWSDEAVEGALHSLISEIKPELSQRAEDSTIQLRFLNNDDEISEDVFFARLAKDHPASGPLLTKLIERYVDTTLQSEFLFSADDESVGFLSSAVLALVRLDCEALAKVQAYGSVVDREHEHRFVCEIVPTVINVCGWTDKVADFVFWVLIRNYFNALTDYNRVWEDWGLKNAMATRDPIEWAQRVFEANRRALTSGKFQIRGRPGGLKQLAQDIPQPHDTWLSAFLKESKRHLRTRLP